MDRLLQRGDTFRLPRLVDASFPHDWVDPPESEPDVVGRVIALDRSVILFERGHTVRWTKKERRDGWDRETPMSLRADAGSRAGVMWHVTEAKTARVAGQTDAHVLYDPVTYYDVWCVYAVRHDKNERFAFRQYADGNGIGDPPNVELVPTCRADATRTEEMSKHGYATIQEGHGLAATSD